MDSPLISVVMPAFNAARTVRRAVESLLGQTEGRFELIAVDDGSTDGTLASLEGLAALDTRVRVVQAAHGGIVAALQRGLAAARGRYVARMDADDVSLPRRFERQLALLETNADIGVASCLVSHVVEDSGSAVPEDSGSAVPEAAGSAVPEAAGSAVQEASGRAVPENSGYALHVDWVNGLVTPEAMALARFVEAPVAHPTVMVRRGLIDRFGGYRDGPFPEDYELWLRWMAHGVRFAKVPEVLYAWSDSPDRLSRTDPRYDVEAFHRIKAGYLVRWLAAHNPFHPAVVIWGGGKSSRRRSAHLEPHGCRIAAYLDIDPKKIGHVRAGKPVLPAVAVGPPGEAFIVSYAGKRGAHEFIRSVLEPKGYVEGRDFVFAT